MARGPRHEDRRVGLRHLVAHLLDDAHAPEEGLDEVGPGPAAARHEEGPHARAARRNGAGAGAAAGPPPGPAGPRNAAAAGPPAGRQQRAARLRERRVGRGLRRGVVGAGGVVLEHEALVGAGAADLLERARLVGQVRREGRGAGGRRCHGQDHEAEAAPASAAAAHRRAWKPHREVHRADAESPRARSRRARTGRREGRRRAPTTARAAGRASPAAAAANDRAPRRPQKKLV